MEKNWLIRTKSNYILGPVSQAKVQELLESSTLKAEDEVCSGNGFWFYIREKELVKRFVYENEIQTFNPVSEAENVLTAKESSFVESKPSQDEEELVLELNPLIEEEKFPEFVEMTAPSKSGAEDIQFPESSDLDYPENTVTDEDFIEEEEHLPPQFDSTSELKEPTKEIKVQRKAMQIEPKIPQKSWLNDKTLFLIAMSMLVIAILAFYYRKRIIEKFIDGQASVSVISPVYAQTFQSTQKKSL